MNVPKLLEPQQEAARGSDGPTAGSMALFAAVCLGLSGVALAGDDIELTPSGHVKSFGIAVLPYDSALMPDTAAGQGTLDGRLNLDLAVGEHVSGELGATLTGVYGSANLGSVGVGTGVTTGAPEAVTLSHAWSSDDGRASARARIDRANVKVTLPGLDLTLGRQAVGFGQGKLFTPLDLVTPLSATTLDTEYKPGVDALRVDGYTGTATSFTAVGAYMGSWDLQGVGLVLSGSTTVGVTDLSALVADLYGDAVLGTSIYAPVGALGFYGDATLTFTNDGPELRGVAGVDARPTDKTSIMGELYVQTFGTNEPSAYLFQYADPRFARGELWLLGHTYAGLAFSQQLSPLWTAGAFGLVNLHDPSALLSGSLSWSAAANAEVAFGVMAGTGKRPQLIARSEFGLMPFMGYVQGTWYF